MSSGQFKHVVHSDRCRGLILPAEIDGEVTLWCSGCGKTLREDSPVVLMRGPGVKNRRSEATAKEAISALGTDTATALLIRQKGTQKTCQSGRHPWTPDNIYVSPKKVASCRKCRRDAARARRG